MTQNEQPGREEPRTKLEAALRYRECGWFPIPLCWPTPEGRCGCGRGHQGKEIGKAPLVGNGYQHLRPTEADVCGWWTRWPDANIGILLEPSSLVVVDVDSPEAEAEVAPKLG